MIKTIKYWLVSYITSQRHCCYLVSEVSLFVQALCGSRYGDIAL